MSYILNQPANRWEDAILTGNGPLVALVFGDVVQDWVLLNHHRCWIEKPRSELPNLAPRLADIRRLQAEGRWDDAAAVFPSILDGHNYREGDSRPFHSAIAASNIGDNFGEDGIATTIPGSEGSQCDSVVP